MGKRQRKRGEHLYIFIACAVTTLTLLCGCSHMYERFMAGPTFKEADVFINQGNYRAALGTYEEIIEKYPTAGDRVLFRMGNIYMYPGNEQKNYEKSLACFRRLIKDYPESEYRQDSELMIAHINNIIIKDTQIIATQSQLETLEKEIRSQGNEIITLRKKLEALEQEFERRVFLIQNGPADRILIEKKERRLTLLSKGRVLTTYKIALGGNPDGPKEREGDNKTPEGIYIIDSRNRDSGYHLSLHISYPNENDKKRAKELGVSPGGNIMIHGIKNGYSWIGELHAESDWTKGCIAVTDGEIEEIEKLVPNGTIVDIRP